MMNTDDFSVSFSFCPMCGVKLPPGTRFCFNCGYDLLRDTKQSEKSTFKEEGVVRRKGILFTNLRVLAQKYHTNKTEVESVLEDFIKSHQSLGQNWTLLDASCFQIKTTEQDSENWHEYADMIDSFCQLKGISTGADLALFIIGGPDVIPQPQTNGDDLTSAYYADLHYCFKDELDLEFLNYKQARCNVGRLPLEVGPMQTTFKEDVAAYLARSFEISQTGAIRIGRAIMTSNRDWIPASREMSRNLPMPHLENDDDDVLDNMFISPNILQTMPDNLSRKYYAELAAADMLVFNLHGSNNEEEDGYYSTALAFSVDMLQHTKASIFNTVACWGARYIRYTREHSLMLQAIYEHQVMLFAGSCAPALGKCGNFQQDQTWVIQPAAYSETFMSRFCEYECLGTMTAGEAFLKAKCDYYNASRAIEKDEYSLATILMFNLYGNPMLCTEPDVQSIASLQREDGTKMQKVPFRRMHRKVVMDSSKSYQNPISGSILNEIRSSVDLNLRMIHERVVNEVYRYWKVEPRQLFSVEHYTSQLVGGATEEGYIYNYRSQDQGISSEIKVFVNSYGVITDAIQTK